MLKQSIVSNEGFRIKMISLEGSKVPKCSNVPILIHRSMRHGKELLENHVVLQIGDQSIVNPYIGHVQCLVA